MEKLLNLFAVVITALFLAGCSITSVRLEAAVDRYGVPAPPEEEMEIEEEDSIEMQDLAVEPPEEEAVHEEEALTNVASLEPRVVQYGGDYELATLVINGEERALYFMLGDGQAIRLPIAVPKAGYEWSGEVTVCNKAENPAWNPSKEMQGYSEFAAEYPDGIAGGDPQNPLGSRALYLCDASGKDTLYRIHGTSRKLRSSIGTAASSGCIRMLNEHIEELYKYVSVGARVIVASSNEDVQG